MSIIGTNLAGSLAGAQAAERVESTEKQKRDAAKRAKAAEANRDGDSVIVHTEALDPARSVKGNAEEEAHEDREEHGLLEPYDRRGHGPDHRPSIDVSV